jgi:ABC-type uncharacterized transport system fused permease/ATPase subunit
MDWNDMQSGGEKKLIARARHFCLKPIFAILVECNSEYGFGERLYTQAKPLKIVLTMPYKAASLYITNS